MSIDTTVLAFVAVGFVARLISSTLGGGFGVISSATLIATGVPPAVASAGAHAAKVVTAPIAGLSHAIAGNVDWKLFRRLAVPGVAGAVLGAWLLATLPISVMKPIVQVYLGGLGLMLLLRGRRSHPHWLTTRLIGPLAMGAGFLDSAGGGGWGSICAPNLILHGIPPRTVVGTVNLSEFLVALASIGTLVRLLGWEKLGHAAFGLMAGAVLAAPLGAMLAKRLPALLLVRLLGSVLVFTSAFGLLRALL